MVLREIIEALEASAARSAHGEFWRAATAQKVRSKVFRELLISALQFGPPPPPCLLGIGRFGAHDYPPSTYSRRKECG